MGLKHRIYPPWSAQATLGVADTTKTVKAAPGAGKALVLTAWGWGVLISAGQTVNVEDTSGTVSLVKLPAAPGLITGGSQGELEDGVQLTTNEALLIKPAAAGPSLHVWAAGYIKGV